MKPSLKDFNRFLLKSEEVPILLVSAPVDLFPWVNHPDGNRAHLETSLGMMEALLEMIGSEKLSIFVPYNIDLKSIPLKLPKGVKIASCWIENGSDVKGHPPVDEDTYHLLLVDKWAKRAKLLF